MTIPRRWPIGAEVHESGVHFRVWSPRHDRISVSLETGTRRGVFPMTPDGAHYYSVFVDGCAPGDRYRFQPGDDAKTYSDPASRYQPEGPHGPSEVVDHRTFPWTDHQWKGRHLRGQVIYELHIGTFTPEGTWQAASEQLNELAECGITVIEIMPVNEFGGRFGWGYDGVNLFAPTHHYGRPDDFRSFVNRAHELNLAVILDVVYNHFGPDGNYLGQYGPYTSREHANEWGENVNFDGPDSSGVREYAVTNAAFWIQEYHLDGLRLDATQAIIDESPKHILREIGDAVRRAAGDRQTIIVNENESQNSRLIRAVDKGGYGLDGMWNDDFHHSAMVALTGKNEAYYSDHLGSPQEFISAAKYGYLFQGQRYSWQEQRRGMPAFDAAPWQFINFLQNHDQIANSGRGLRCQMLTSPGRYRALTAAFLLLPGTPMLFMGQEFASSAPFQYFAGHSNDLAQQVFAGRAEFLKQFRSLDREGFREGLPRPDDESVFQQCKLDFAERQTHSQQYRLHKDLLKMRRDVEAFQPTDVRTIDGAVLGPDCWMLRFFTGSTRQQGDRLLIVNMGRDLHRDQLAEPLLAPPEDCRWVIAWTSDSPDYSGDGTPPLETVSGWHLPGETAVVLAPQPGLPDAVRTAKKDAEVRVRRERTAL